MKGLWGIVIVLWASSTLAQDLQKNEPKTKLEAFTGASGAVLLKGYTEVGSVKGMGSVVGVTAMIFRNAATGKETSGIIIEIRDLEKSYSAVPRSYIDYDEIAGLLEGMDYIARADSSVTKLRNFEAIYSTKGDLKITVFNQTNGKLNAAIQAGHYSSQNAFLTLNQLKEFRGLLVKAKQAIDDPADQQTRNHPAAPTSLPAASEPIGSPTLLFSPSTNVWKR